MPYAHCKKKIPRKLDRRVKITEEHKRKIQALYHLNHWGIRKIARYFSAICSRRAIQFILFPERAEISKAKHKEIRLDGRYYNKEFHTKQIREHRQYKESIKDKLI